MTSIVETACVASLLGFALLLVFAPAHGAEIACPQTCRVSIFAMAPVLDQGATKAIAPCIINAVSVKPAD